MSIADQLRTLKSAADTEPLRQPFTRPSILLNPKEAADIDIDNIFSVASSGLAVLISKNEGFSIFQRDLFNEKSKEFDREVSSLEVNNRINGSIASYLKLLSGYFQSLPARKTLEYLIRRYKIHVYNIEELILCTLPYHETYEFVRVVQLIDTGNTRWKFLAGVKVSGAPLSRRVIVQQCIRDLGVLDVICGFAMPVKKVQPAKVVTRFCTAVVVEVLGALTAITSDVVNKIVPYVLSGLQPIAPGSGDHKAGALMIVGLLALKTKMSADLVRTLIHSVVGVVQEHLKEANDLQLFRMPLMTLINLVQLQNVGLISRKSMDLLIEVRDIVEILSGFTEEFNINKFLTVFLNSLLEYSTADQTYHHTFIVIIETKTIPLQFYVRCLVSKLLKTCTKISGHMNQPRSSELGSQAKEILVSLYKIYPTELIDAMEKVLQCEKKGSNELFLKIIDGDGKLSSGAPDSGIFFALEHPKAEIRRSAVTGLDVAGILNDKAANSKAFDVIQDAIVRRLLDDDLPVVQAALNVQHLNEIISASVFLDTLQSVLERCVSILNSGATDDTSMASDVAISCLRLAIMTFKDNFQFSKKLAKMILPLILIIPKTQKLNLESLELVKEVKWPLFGNLVKLSGSEKKPSLEDVCSVNVQNIGKLAEAFSVHCDELMPWLLECSNTNELSKTVYFLILLQSSIVHKPDFAQFSVLFDASFQLLQREENVLESADVTAEENLNSDGDCRTFLKRLRKTSGDEFNAEILISLCWRLVEGFVITLPDDNDTNEIWSCKLQSLFVFFVTRERQIFKKQLQYLVSKCKASLLGFLSKMFIEEGFVGQVQAESLHYFGYLCSLAESDEDLQIQLLNEFPTLLVPLTGDDKDVQLAARGCCEELLKLWTHANLSRNKIGNSVHFLGELLSYLVQEKGFLLHIQSMFECLLSSTDSLLVPKNTGKRFDQSTKDDILRFLLSSALKLSASAKLKIISLLKYLGNKVTEFSEIKSLLGDLLQRRQDYHVMHNDSAQKLCHTDIHLLNLLLEMCTMSTSSTGGKYFEYLVMALKVNGSTSEDSAIVEPCITVLKHLNNSLYLGLKAENQEILMCDLAVLFRNGNASIRNSAREALLQINTNYLVVGKMLGSVGQHLSSLSGSNVGRKKKKSTTHLDDMYIDVFRRGGGTLSFLISLLDAVLLKKDMENRSFLIGPLNEVLRLIFINDEWVPRIVDEANDCFQVSPEVSVSSSQVYIQQTSLSVLEDICSSSSVSEKDAIKNNLDLELLVKCARLSSDAMTCNQVLSLFSAVAKVVPEKVLNHILDILNVIGELAVTKWDAYSQSVFEEFLTAVVPFWSSETGDVEIILQIFVDVLPHIPQHQKLSIMECLLRNLGESGSFGSFLFLLFNSSVLKGGISSFAERELFMHLKSAIKTKWEYIFALELSVQYSCTIWLPSLVVLLERLGKAPWNKDHFVQLTVAMQFVLEKLQNPEILFKLESGEYADQIQMKLGSLLEQAVFTLQQVNIRGKHVVSSDLRKGLKELMHDVLKSIVKSLVPVSYFGVMIQLLRHTDKNVRKKALGLLCETAKEGGAMNKINQRRGSGKGLRSMWLEFDENAQRSLNKMCMEILNLVDDSDLDSGGASLKLASISTLEAFVFRFPLDDLTLLTCLKSVSINISSSNSSVSSACLRTTSALINVLGPKALSELPGIMESMFHKSRDISLLIAKDNHNGSVSVSSRTTSDSIVISVLVILEALVDKLGGFLNPYLGNLLELLVLHPCYATTTDVKIKMRADLVRKLVTDKIPVRLLLPALKRIYSDAIKSGESSVSITFEMIGDMVLSMDRSSISAYHVQIFDLGLLALDLRGQHIDSINRIHAVEEKIIVSIVSLTLKLTETMFKPLFVKSIEWSRSHIGEGEENKNIDRSLSFYGLVNKLVESHRSLFVPFFKYLLDGCVHYLSEDMQVDLAPKKKKLKSHEGIEKKDTGSELSVGVWHLRALVTSSLQKCFLYDTGSSKFLTSNFQALLKPLVSQLVVDPPASLDQHPEVPSIEKVDDILVACIGQMAVTAESDLLWKPLNHEVLMQTRSGKVRARMLGLRIVKYLVENLKEEYLVLLPETIPFLAELLEDVELPVKALAQEILKQMEFMSGESLREYL